MKCRCFTIVSAPALPNDEILIYNNIETVGVLSFARSWLVTRERVQVGASQSPAKGPRRAGENPPMKFGKRLTAEAARRWAEHYVDYKALKRAVKDDAGRGGALLVVFDGVL